MAGAGRAAMVCAQRVGLKAPRASACCSLGRDGADMVAADNNAATIDQLSDVDGNGSELESN
ncbi:hypothetical protein FHU38_000292 [Saccharomonospora amisosensis]|uniref:Uncharacterized protein n=1 Tax=Saccharomonospora amisosensis TaxID=1128677 RepID=A0A7X5UL22_9PSEU|nr:hypothetical protein [Saccharomonospora amisosensis]NIJ09948.1 hypothetical protein [Saccharomonospora amisosensis]